MNLSFQSLQVNLKSFLKHLVKSVIISFFDLPFTNTKIISQYRSPYTPCGDLNSLPLYVTEIR